MVGILNDIRYKMTLKAVVKYIDYRLKHNEDDFLYRAIVAESLATIAVGKKSGERVSYINEHNKLFNINNKKEDKRSAKDIIKDTFKAHNITIREE